MSFLGFIFSNSYTHRKLTIRIGSVPTSLSMQAQDIYSIFIKHII